MKQVPSQKELKPNKSVQFIDDNQLDSIERLHDQKNRDSYLNIRSRSTLASKIYQPHSSNLSPLNLSASVKRMQQYNTYNESVRSPDAISSKFANKNVSPKKLFQ